MSEPLLSPEEYYNNLNAIWFKTWGEEIRWPTLNNIIALSDETDTYGDISAELATIKDDIYGNNVRIAIHDALYKLQNAIDTHAGDLEKEIERLKEEITALEALDHYSADVQVSSIPIIFSQYLCAAYSKDDTMKFSYHQQDTDSAQLSVTESITVDRPCTLLACAMHRSDVTISDEGFTHFVTSEGIDPGNRNQRITIWTKEVQAGTYTYTITATDSEPKQMTAKTIAIYGASGFTVVEDRVFPTYQVPQTPVAKNGKRRLYILSSAAAYSGQMAIVISNYEMANIQKMEETRFSAFYDYQPDIDDLPSFTWCSGTLDYNWAFMNLLTIDITEV